MSNRVRDPARNRATEARVGRIALSAIYGALIGAPVCVFLICFGVALTGIPFMLSHPAREGFLADFFGGMVAIGFFVGLPLGIPLGSVLGLLIGLTVGIVKAARRADAKPAKPHMADEL